jgi:hypothetical protein
MLALIALAGLLLAGLTTFLSILLADYLTRHLP